MFFCIESERDNVLLSLENPPLCFVNLTPPKRTPSVQRLSKTKFTKCVALKTNKRRTNNSYLWCLFMFRQQSCVLSLYVPPFSLFLFSLPSGHLQVIPGGRIMSAMSAQQSLHHRGCHPVWLSERLLPRRHGQTGGRVHE